MLTSIHFLPVPRTWRFTIFSSVNFKTPELLNDIIGGRVTVMFFMKLQ